MATLTATVTGGNHDGSSGGRWPCATAQDSAQDSVAIASAPQPTITAATTLRRIRSRFSESSTHIACTYLRDGRFAPLGSVRVLSERSLDSAHRDDHGALVLVLVLVLVL